MTLMPGPVLYLVYLLTKSCFEGFHLSLFDQKANVAVITATFAFTMLGFLAAVITILIGLRRNSLIRRYDQKGYFSVFYWIYFFSIISLFFTFGCALLSLSDHFGDVFMKLAIGSTVNNLAQVLLMTIILVNISTKSSTQL